MDGLPDNYRAIVQRCIQNDYSKEETLRYAQEVHQIPPQDTNRVWNHVERTNPGLFIAQNERMREHIERMREQHERMREHIESMREQNERIHEGVASSWPQEGTSAPPPLPPPARLSNVQRYAAASPHANANAVENQNLQASQQLPAYPNDFWQQLVTTLGQIQSNTQHLGQIQSNTDQMVKLLTDGHGLGLPHPSAAGSSKRKRVGEAEERGKSKQQKKEEGDANEAEKVQGNKRAGDEEAEKVQENERGDNEEEEKLQEKEEGNEGEAAGKMQD